MPNGIASLSTYKSDPPAYIGVYAQLTLTDGHNVRTRNFSLHRVPTGDSVISGYVTAGGLPVAGLAVSGWLAGYSMVDFHATTGPDGFYELTNLPAGTLTLSFSSMTNEFQPLTTAQMKTVVPTPFSHLTKDLELVRWNTGDAEISGVLLDSRTGLPVSGAQMTLAAADPLNPWLGGAVNSSGAWHVSGVPAGTYTLYVEAFSNAYLWQTTGTEIVIAEHESLTRTDYVTSLAPGESAISGKVSDNVTHLPLEAAEVTLIRHLGGFEVTPILTDATGAYSFGTLPDGLYSISVFKDGYEYGLGSISVAGGNETRNIRLLPTASALTGEGTIGGTVLDSLGLPIPDASVYVSAPGFPGGYQSAYTDENGHFDLTDLPLGDLSLEVTQPSIGFVSYASYSADVHLTLADPAVNLDIVLADAASIAGVVTSDTGEITGNLVAEAIDAASGEVVRVGQVDWISGEYLLGQLPASDYIVRIAQQSGFQQTPDLPDPSLSLGQSYWVVGDPDGSAERDDATLVTLVAGDDAVGRDLLVRQGGSIGGYVDVATADGTIPLPAGRIIRVNVYHLEGSDWQLLDFATAETSQYSASEFIASGLATGAYKLEFVDMWEGNRAYVTTYENGAATLEDAPSILVVAGAVTHTGTTTLTVVAPADDPFSVDLGALSDEELAGLEDGITTDGEPTAGEETEINVGEDFAGEWVAVWGNSTPTKISDWVQVATDGTIVVTLPSTLIGSHKVIVQDADQQPLGWAPVEIAAPTPASTGGSGTTTTPPAKPRTNGSLATTPTPTTTTPAPTEETESPDERIPVTGNAADEPEVTAEAGFNFVPIWALLAALLLALIVGGVVIVRRRAA